MKKWLMVREVHVVPNVVEIPDDTPEDKILETAIDLFNNGNATSLCDEMEYSHSLDPEYWTIEKAPY